MISVAHDESPAVFSATRSITSLVLGDIDVTDDVVMSFPTPLLGFPDHREYALLPAAREGLWWMQSTTDGGVTFLLADPFVLDIGYGVDLGETERATLRIGAPTDAFSLVMLSLPSMDGEQATGNFRAPLVFNLHERLGMQIVSRDESHELRRPVTLDVFPPQPSGLRMR
jgi:flagellar assembly factor FliW